MFRLSGYLYLTYGVGQFVCKIFTRFRALPEYNIMFTYE